MGTLYKAECACGCTYGRIAAGCGLGAKNENMIRRGVPEAMYSEFCHERSLDNVDDYILGNAVTVCDSCKEINVVSRFYYKLKNTGKEFLYIGNCPKCGKELEEIDNISEIPCPECGKKMNLSEIGFWD